MAIKKIPSFYTQGEGILIPNELYDGDGKLIISNVDIKQNTLLGGISNEFIQLIKESGKDIVYTTNIGEYHNPINQTTKELVSIFGDKITIKSGLIDFKSNEINHEPILFWIGKSKLDGGIDLNKERKFTHTWLIKLRGPRPHRLKMFDLLEENGVIQYSLYSYRSSEPNIDGYKSLEEYPITDNNEQQQMIVKDYFLKSFCSIILESITDNVFITEKLDKCLLAKQPFIIFGGSNYLNHLKELGFKTFDKWWDETYDMEISEEKRMNQIVDLVTELSQLTLSQCERIYKEMYDVLEHNYNLRNKIKNNYQHEGCYSDVSYIKNNLK